MVDRVDTVNDDATRAMGEWRSIGSYEPRAHGRVDLWCVSYVVSVPRSSKPQEPAKEERRFTDYEWNGLSQHWESVAGKTLNTLEWQVTHWMPPPAPPRRDEVTG